LLMQDGEDRRVPMEHWSRFVDAARDAGVEVESHLYPQEGHGFLDPASRAEYYLRLERFLAQHIGPGAVVANKP
ncbi:MAG: prolyl oligopeptidase family serine peptidase, partial [Rubrivivax sp.]|nr:prolyl oligopeptidase family serine peptidase [Rubrivivax sp.]